MANTRRNVREAVSLLGSVHGRTTKEYRRQFDEVLRMLDTRQLTQQMPLLTGYSLDEVVEYTKIPLHHAEAIYPGMVRELELSAFKASSHVDANAWRHRELRAWPGLSRNSADVEYTAHERERRHALGYRNRETTLNTSAYGFGCHDGRLPSQEFQDFAFPHDYEAESLVLAAFAQGWARPRAQ